MKIIGCPEYSRQSSCVYTTLCLNQTSSIKLFRQRALQDTCSARYTFYKVKTTQLCKDACKSICAKITIIPDFTPPEKIFNIRYLLLTNLQTGMSHKLLLEIT